MNTGLEYNSSLPALDSRHHCQTCLSTLGLKHMPTVVIRELQEGPNNKKCSDFRPIGKGRGKIHGVRNIQHLQAIYSSLPPWEVGDGWVLSASFTLMFLCLYPKPQVLTSM